jgi:hypothetical protein
MKRTLLIAIAILVVGIIGTAGAASLITGKDIKNNSLKTADVKNHTLKKKDLKKGLAASLKGEPGTDGTDGVDGVDGQDATYSGAAWSIIDRNTEGSPVAALRAGPSFGAAANAKPPLGIGSLGMETADNTEKLAFGNMEDFAGDPVSGLSQIGFSYLVTGEDLGRYAGNTPNITLEINPSVATKDYTSMVYVPANPPATTSQEWVNDDADANPGTTSGWWFSNGLVSGATGCTQANFCSLAEAQAALLAQNDGGPAAAIGSIAVAKGKDYQYQGAVDALRINNEVFDFEPFGVTVSAP